MNKLRLRIARIAVAVAGAALCWACNAPFIPIPPPQQTVSFSQALVSDGDAGQRTVWTAHGPPFPEAALARFYIFDTNRAAGVIAEAAADGSYTSPPMEGTLGDRVEISFETPGGATSSDTCFQLTEDVPSAPKCLAP
jgi:hypothetical protein